MAIKRYNGSSQVTQTVKRWNGSLWVKQIVKRWNGSDWVNVSTKYTWQKWSVKTVTTVQSYKLVSISTYDYGISDDSQETTATSYDFNTETGDLTVSGSANLWSNGGGYNIDDGNLEVKNVVVSGVDPRSGTVYVTIYDVQPDQTSSHQEKDAYIEDVTSYDSEAYPDDGQSGDYWYIKVS